MDFSQSVSSLSAIALNNEECAMPRPITLTLIGGPTVLIEYGGYRLLTDPTFDPPGPVSRPAQPCKARQN